MACEVAHVDEVYDSLLTAYQRFGYLKELSPEKEFRVRDDVRFTFSREASTDLKIDVVVEPTCKSWDVVLGFLAEESSEKIVAHEKGMYLNFDGDSSMY